MKQGYSFAAALVALFAAGFNWRGNCKHVREVREKVFEA